MLFDYFRCHFAFGLGNHQGTTCFIMYFYQLFRMLQNVVSLTVSDVPELHKMHPTFSGNVMVLILFRIHFAKMVPGISLNDMFHKVF